MATAIFDNTAVTDTHSIRGRSVALNAQKFTIAAAKVIKYYKLKLLQYSTAGNARVCIYTDDGGTPSLPSTIVANSTVLKAANTIAGDVRTLYQLDIASPPTLEAGTYWMVMDDNAETTPEVYSGLCVGTDDGTRKLYAGSTTNTEHTWVWGLWADDPSSSGNPHHAYAQQ